jgi:gluconolactonase
VKPGSIDFPVELLFRAEWGAEELCMLFSRKKIFALGLSFTLLSELGACDFVKVGMELKSPSVNDDHSQSPDPLAAFDRIDQITDTSQAEVLLPDLGFAEGPLWHPEHYLIFSHPAAPGLTMSVYMYDANLGAEIYSRDVGSNGMALDRNKKLIVCDQDHRRIAREDSPGNWTSLGDMYMGKRLNRPNDCVVRKSDNVVYFTDPDYGLDPADKDLDFNGVHRALGDGTIDRIAADVDFQLPNGIAFSPDQKFLYVGDNGKDIIWKFPVENDGTLGQGAQLITAESGSNGPDGMKVDTHGHLYIASRDGIRVFRPDGKMLGTIATPEAATNCAFGDDDYKTLYITTGNGVYKAKLKVAGIAP